MIENTMKILCKLHRVKNSSALILTSLRFGVAIRERITGVTFGTSTHWYMDVNVTLGVQSARARARILAFLVDAGQII